GEHVLGGGAAGPLDRPEQAPARGGGLQGGELGPGQRRRRHHQRRAGRRRRHGRWRRRRLGHDRRLRIGLRRGGRGFRGHGVGVVAEPVQRLRQAGEVVTRRGRLALRRSGDGDERQGGGGKKLGETHTLI